MYYGVRVWLSYGVSGVLWGEGVFIVWWEWCIMG